jgi:hypothetical protein
MVELKDGKRATILDIYDDPPGYLVEDFAVMDDPDYPDDEPVAFGVPPEEIKRMLDPSEIPPPLEPDVSKYVLTK